MHAPGPSRCGLQEQEKLPVPVVVLLQILKHGPDAPIVRQGIGEVRQNVKKLTAPLLDGLRPGDDGLRPPVQLRVKGLDHEGMRRQFLAACAAKPERHEALSYAQRSGANRSMNRIGG